MSVSKRMVVFGLASALFGVACSGGSAPEASTAADIVAVAEHVDPPVTNPELDGYCPVALVEMKMLEKGSRDYQSRYADRVYQMTNDKSETMFQANPTRYVPPFGTFDAVVFRNSGERVEGSVQIFTVYNDQPWFFVNEDNKTTFLESPDDYVASATGAS